MKTNKRRGIASGRRDWAGVLRRMGFSAYFISRVLGVSRSTVYRYLRQEKGDTDGKGQNSKKTSL
jgi:predicted transcriptional regulator